MDTKIKDRTDFIAAYGEHAMVVLANPGTRDYELVAMENIPPTAEQHADFVARGLYFVAAFGIVLGKFQAHYVFPIPIEDACALGLAYRKLLDSPRPKDDSGAVDWLRSLWNMPDSREAN